MNPYINLQTFFKTLNSCTTIEGIENALKNLIHRDIKLRIFEESIGNNTEDMNFLNSIHENLEAFQNFIDGNPICINKNTLYPILLKEQLIGCLELDICNKNELNNLALAALVIALKIDNIRLSGTINKSLEFHNAMKNIAKIIETQYELNYILPIIGEILDTFIENHLIYIFLKTNGKMKLMWPATCLDKNIPKKVAQLTNAKDVSFSKNNKIAYFPLISENTNIGFIVSKSTEGEISSQEIYHIQQLSKQTATTITRAKVYAEILKYATLDALTGFYNRRQLDERVKQEVSHAKRKKAALCSIMVDIDFFKSVNDTYGHTAGDLVLKTVAKIMRGQLREYDIAARYGGEEFMILLPYTSIKEAVLVAERLRKSVKNKIIDIEKVNTKNNTKNINVTISIGLCEYKEKYTADQFIMNTDKALYDAKETGRNRIIVYNE